MRSLLVVENLIDFKDSKDIMEEILEITGGGTHSTVVTSTSVGFFFSS